MDGSSLPGARFTRSGKIKTRLLAGSNLALLVTLAVLAALTVFAMATMDYGNVSFFEALGEACGDFFTMMTQPGLAGHFTLADACSSRWRWPCSPPSSARSSRLFWAFWRRATLPTTR